MKNLFVLDLETTGLDKEKCQILQLALIKVDDLDKPNEEYERLNLYMVHEHLSYVEPKAAGMVAKTIESMKEASPDDIIQVSAAKHRWGDFLSKHYTQGEKFTFAGKNLSTFDLEILKNQQFPLFSISHRVLDVGSLYYADFGYIPSLGEINKLIGKSEVSHNALLDCYDVINAVKWKMKGKL